MSSTPGQIIKKLFEVVTKDKILDSFRRMYVYKTIRPGTLVGKDHFGNAYYEAPAGTMEIRQRFVEMAGPKGDINATAIPPEWHMWMTWIRDVPPTKLPVEQPKYLVNFKPTELSKMGEHANFVPCHYYVKPRDVQSVNYPTKKYETWTPSASQI